MAASFENRGGGGRIVPVLAFGAGCWYALDYTGPLMMGADINLPAALAYGGVGLAGLTVTVDMARLVARFIEWRDAQKPTGVKGTAGFIKARKELRRELIEKSWGPFWGSFQGRELVIDYASNALTAAPAGAKKDVGVVQPTVLAIRESKTIIDFKGTSACVLAEILRARRETVRIVNLGDVWGDILGKSDTYNPLCITADDYWCSGGLADITDDIHEKCMKLYPEPAGGGGKDDNRFFRDGSRTLIGFAIQLCIMTKGYDATLGDVLQLLNDRKSLLQHARWAANRLEVEVDGEMQISEFPLADSPWAHLHNPADIEKYDEYFCSLAAGIADILEAPDTRTVDSFLTGAQQALSRFNITTRAAKKTSSTSFRFADQKSGNGATTVFIIADSSRMEAQKPVLDLIQWCMTQEWKRADNKQKPVYFVANEATNFKIDDGLLTWGREFGIRIHVIIQSLAAYRRVYGPEALKTLLSETEIKQFPAGQREPEILKLIEELLGQQSVVVKSHNDKREEQGFGIDGGSYSETGRPLMTEDEIRRTDKTITFIRDNKPLLNDLPSIAAIAPWRKKIGINPMYGKPYLLPVELRIRGRDGSLLRRAFRALANLFQNRRSS